MDSALADLTRAFAADYPPLDAEQATAAAARDLPWRRQLRSRLLGLYDAVVALAGTAGPHDFASDALAGLAAAVRAGVPPRIEDPMAIRARVFVRLLRHDALESARTLAADSAVGTVRTGRAELRWAGGRAATSALPLPIQLDGERVFVWLPGFRDPRAQVPDDIYDVSRNVQVRGRLHRIRWGADGLELAGSAYLRVVGAAASDVVTVAAVHADGTRVEVAARRARSPEFVGSRGPDLVRLAWSGWHARLSAAGLAARPGAWRLELAVARAQIRRSAPLGAERGPALEHVTDFGSFRVRAVVLAAGADSDGQITVTSTRRSGLRGLFQRRAAVGAT